MADGRAGGGTGEHEIATDVPFVDGRAASSEQLRAEVARARDPLVQEVDDARDALIEAAEVLAQRLSPRPALAQVLNRPRVALFAVGALLAFVVVRGVRRPVNRGTAETGRRAREIVLESEA